MNKRKDRLADEIRDLIARCLLSGQMGNPNLAGVTILEVRLSGDLQIASVYFRVFGDVPIKKSLVALQRSSGLLRKHLADSLDIRRVPQLRFFYDKTPETAEKIEQLLAQAKQESSSGS